MGKLRWLGSKFVWMALMILGIWMFGGSSVIRTNPIIIVFGLIVLIFVMWGKK